MNKTWTLLKCSLVSSIVLLHKCTKLKLCLGHYKCFQHLGVPYIQVVTNSVDCFVYISTNIKIVVNQYFS
jgi:hypothetical protein